MGLRILHGDVLDAGADAIILPIDGTAKGMEGNVARAFSRRWPMVWKEIEDEVRYPVPLGTAVDIEPSEGCSFRLILLVSTLHHRDILSLQQKMGVVRSALEEAGKLAWDYEVKTVASPLLKGGWRLPNHNAFLAMADAYESLRQSQRTLDLTIYILDLQQYQEVATLASSMGWGMDA